MPRLQVCSGCGAGAPPDAHFCPQCSKILALDQQTGDYFSFLGLPRKLRIDQKELDERYRVLSRKLHPDYFCNADPADRRASLDRSARLNDAYRALRMPATRMAYLLELEQGTERVHGTGDRHDAPPATLLEEVFALNEELDDIRRLRANGAARNVWAERLDQARQPIEARRADHEAELEVLAKRWDDAVDAGSGDAERRRILAAVRERLLERNYISNLVAGIERELAH